MAPRCAPHVFDIQWTRSQIECSEDICIPTPAVATRMRRTTSTQTPSSSPQCFTANGVQATFAFLTLRTNQFSLGKATKLSRRKCREHNHCRRHNFEMRRFAMHEILRRRLFCAGRNPLKETDLCIHLSDEHCKTQRAEFLGCRLHRSTIAQDRSTTAMRLRPSCDVFCARR